MTFDREFGIFVHDNINLRGISPGGVDTFLFPNNGELKLFLVTIRK